MSFRYYGDDCDSADDISAFAHGAASELAAASSGRTNSGSPHSAQPAPPDSPSKSDPNPRSSLEHKARLQPKQALCRGSGSQSRLESKVRLPRRTQKEACMDL